MNMNIQRKTLLPSTIPVLLYSNSELLYEAGAMLSSKSPPFDEELAPCRLSGDRASGEELDSEEGVSG